MKDAELIDKINELLSHAEICSDGYSSNERKRYIVHFMHYFEERKGYITFRIAKEHAQLYQEALLAIFEKGNIKDNYVLKTIENKFNRFLLQTKVNQEQVTESCFSKFFNGINMSATNKITVFHKIYGLVIDSDTPVSVGEFTLYNYKLHKESLIKISGYTSETDLLEYHEDFAAHDNWIGTEVEVVDSEKAYELACARFEVFQGVCQFILDLEGLNARAVCILRDIMPVHDSCYMFTGIGTHSKDESDFRRIKDININHFLYDDNHIFTNLIERLFGREKSEVNNRLKNAFTTYGRMLYEYSNSQRLIMYVTVVESLIEFKSQDVSELIAKYLSSMISDDLDAFNKRKQSFKSIYNQRSEISHGSLTSITDGDLLCAKSNTIALVHKFIKDNEIQNFKKNKELKAHLESKVKRLKVQEP